jgi:hypothetical protein
LVVRVRLFKRRLDFRVSCSTTTIAAIDHDFVPSTLVSSEDIPQRVSTSHDQGPSSVTCEGDVVAVAGNWLGQSLCHTGEK